MAGAAVAYAWATGGAGGTMLTRTLGPAELPLGAGLAGFGVASRSPALDSSHAVRATERPR